MHTNKKALYLTAKKKAISFVKRKKNYPFEFLLILNLEFNYKFFFNFRRFISLQKIKNNNFIIIDYRPPTKKNH